jgi:hypothetical protein
MKRNLMILSLVVAVTFIGSFALAGSGARMRITVPFNFYVEDQLLPAGDYTFEMISDLAPRGSRVFIKPYAGVGMFLSSTVPGKDDQESVLLFNKYGSRYFLSSISILGTKATVKTRTVEREYRARMQNQSDVATIALK